MIAKRQEPKHESVKVIVRCRPFLDAELKRNEQSSLLVEKDTNQVSILRDRASHEYKTFRFDAVFDEHASQQDIYNEAAFSVVEGSFSGYNGTVFAYGQTGCGKTHTMVGGRPDQVAERGIMPNVFDHVFQIVNSYRSNDKLKVLIRCSFVEIYNEEIRDLLCKYLLFNNSA